MNDPRVVPPQPPAVPGPDSNRVFLFLLVQTGFLVLSPFAGGFHYKVWSMLDSALLIAAIGVTALALIFDDATTKKAVLRSGVFLYLLGVIDMSVNVLLSGWFGWMKNPLE